MMPRVAIVVVFAVGLACQRLAGDEVGVDSCGGLLTAAPTQLAVSSSSSSLLDLFVDGDTLVLVEPGQAGRLRRIDRCSGAELDAIEVPLLARAVVHEGEVVMTGVSDGPSPFLLRWDEAGDALVMLAEQSFSHLYSHPTGLYLAEGTAIHRFDAASGTIVLVHVIDAPDDVPSAVAHVGIHEAGIYYRLDYDTGFGPMLLRWPIGAAEAGTVEGSTSAMHLAARGDRIITSVDQVPELVGSGIRNIIALPAIGGAATLLYTGSAEDPWIRDIAANEAWVCWSGGPSVRCVDAMQSEDVHVRDSPGGSRRVVLADDALYWWAEVDDGHVLMAAAL